MDALKAQQNLESSPKPRMITIHGYSQDSTDATIRQEPEASKRANLRHVLPLLLASTCILASAIYDLIKLSQNPKGDDFVGLALIASSLLSTAALWVLFLRLPRWQRSKELRRI